jgi:hypothetical protein
MHHADAGGDRVTGALDSYRLAVDQDLSLVRLQQSVEDIHQGGLARTVLAEQGVNLPGFDGQVDVVIGDQVAETLGDAAQFESQRNLPCAVGDKAAGPRGDDLTTRAGLVSITWAPWCYLG